MVLHWSAPLGVVLYWSASLGVVLHWSAPLGVVLYWSASLGVVLHWSAPLGLVLHLSAPLVVGTAGPCNALVGAAGCGAEWLTPLCVVMQWSAPLGVVPEDVGSSVLAKYFELGCVIPGSHKKRPDALIEHAYARFHAQSTPILMLLPSKSQMRSFQKFVRTVLALASDKAADERCRLDTSAGVFLIIPPDSWIGDAKNFEMPSANQRLERPVHENWTKLSSGVYHRESTASKVNISKGQHQRMAARFDSLAHRDEVYEGNGDDDPPFEADVFDEMCRRNEILNQRYDAVIKALWEQREQEVAEAPSKKRKGTSSAATASAAVLEHELVEGVAGRLNLNEAPKVDDRRSGHQLKEPPLYAANAQGKFFSSQCTRFNLSQLNTILDLMPIAPGVSTDYVYFGMRGTTAPWHREDGSLFSIFYSHAGSAAKYWYCVSQEHSRDFEAVAARLMPEMADRCPRFLDHKESLIAPGRIVEEGVPVNTVVQLASTFALTACDVYHQVFNSGYVQGTAINFALESWFPFCKQIYRNIETELCRHDTKEACPWLDGTYEDGRRKDDFYRIEGVNPDGKSYKYDMSRRRLVVHVKPQYFKEHVAVWNACTDPKLLYVKGAERFLQLTDEVPEAEPLHSRLSQVVMEDAPATSRRSARSSSRRRLPSASPERQLSPPESPPPANGSEEVPAVAVPEFRCEDCGKSFSKRFNLKEHHAKKRCEVRNAEDRHKCGFCKHSFSSVDAMKRHMAGIHHQNP
ncbi:JmjC domain containing protein [Aphelenchoides avenae]|nr:JmjC domain containing protein [Aphelenchus avenae]